MEDHKLNFFEHASTACEECVFLSDVWSCKSPAGACMYRGIAGIPSLLVGEIVEHLGIELPEEWRERIDNARSS